MQELTADDSSVFEIPQNLCVFICQCILEEALNQLYILQRIRNDLNIRNVNKLSVIADKNPEGSRNQVAENFKSNIRKFEKNFEFIQHIIQATYEELGSNGTYDKLIETLKEYKQSKLKETHIKEETARLQTELKDLECTLYEEEIFYHRKIAQCMADIGKVKDEIEDFLVESEIKIDYIEKWQNSKIEMNEILLEGKEERMLTGLKKMDADMYKESRVHQEIIAAYNEMQKDIINEMKKWEEKYDKDYKELQVKIQAIKEKREKQSEATRILKETYQKREKEINDYKLYKVHQEEKRLILQKRNEAATKIQAWWRGTMVRKGFGKFRKKKDKKGKKK